MAAISGEVFAEKNLAARRTGRMRNVSGTCSLEVFGTLISQADKFFEENESASYLP